MFRTAQNPRDNRGRRTLLVVLAVLVAGCGGTPPATPVTKAVTVTCKTPDQTAKPIYVVIYYKNANNQWQSDAAVTINWTAEPDGDGNLHGTANWSLQTGRYYKFVAAGSFSIDPNTGWFVVAQENEYGTHTTEDPYDGEQTSFDLGLQ